MVRVVAVLFLVPRTLILNVPVSGSGPVPGPSWMW